MESLYDGVSLKQTWNSERSGDDQWIFSNFLIQGDRGFTVPQLFSFLQDAGLEFISMVRWQTWNLRSLFHEIPEFMAEKLKNLDVAQRLHLFDLVHPIHRLLDFWCGHHSGHAIQPPQEWTTEEWRRTTAVLHPQLKTEERKQELLRCVRTRQSYLINDRLTEFDPVWIEGAMAACLLPLWDETQTVQSLVDRWLKIHPVDPVTLEPSGPEHAFDSIRALLVDLEYPAFVLLDRTPA
jgi:hypothetical protein